MVDTTLSLKPGRFQKPAPPPKPEETETETVDQVDLESARSRKETASGGWKKWALLGVATLGAAAGTLVDWNSGPAEPAQVLEVPTPEEVSDLQETSGLNAIPSDWIPYGETRAYTEGPLGVARGTTTRSPQRIFLDLDGRINPDITLTNLGEGKVEAYVDLPGPFDQKSVGTLERRGAELEYRSENGTTTATFTKSEDGTLEATLKRKGWADWNLTYEPIRSR